MNNYRKVKNGRRNINFEETTGARKSWEYILLIRIRITRKHKCHIVEAFITNHKTPKNRLRKSSFIKKFL